MAGFVVCVRCAPVFGTSSSFIRWDFRSVGDASQWMWQGLDEGLDEKLKKICGNLIRNDFEILNFYEPEEFSWLPSNLASQGF